MATVDTSLIDRAIIFATKAHAGVPRRGKKLPYIVHPMEVASIVATISDDQELLAAALLHDVVEDTEFTIEDIRREFGDRVAKIVESESDKLAQGETLEGTWKARKQAAIDRLAKASLESKIVALGDKLSNIRAICRDVKEKGKDFFKIFHVSDPKEHEWHYRGLAESLKELSNTEAYQEFVAKIEETFK